MKTDSTAVPQPLLFSVSPSLFLCVRAKKTPPHPSYPTLPPSPKHSSGPPPFPLLRRQLTSDKGLICVPSQMENHRHTGQLFCNATFCALCSQCATSHNSLVNSHHIFLYFSLSIDFFFFYDNDASCSYKQ